MKGRLAAPALTLSLALVLASPVHASFHLNQVNEVFPSLIAPQQFVELKDPVAESFPPPDDYWLALHDGAGVLRQKQKLPSAEFRNSTLPYLVGAAPPYDEPLAFALPTTSGQLCFYKGDPATPTSIRVNCLGYGNVTMPLGDVGPAPPAGESVQRLQCGSIGAAPPTRDAENAACPSGGGGGAGGDTTAPTERVRAKRTQDVDKVVLYVRSSEDATVTVRATVSVPVGAARTLRFNTVKKSLKAGVRKKIRLRLSRRRKRLVKTALHSGRKLKAKITITAKDAAGNKTVKKRKIRLKD